MVREVFLGNTVPFHPNTMVQTHDDGFVIAGAGGATKIDSTGKVKWRYPASFHEGVIEYHGVAVMSDDSVVLCGSASRRAGASAPGVVTRIGKDGEVRTEQLLVPQNSASSSINRLFACIARDDSIILVGSSDQFVKNPKPPPPMTDHQFYWMMEFGQDGQLKWEKLTPPSDRFIGNPDSMGPIQMAADGGFFFAARRAGKTEIVHVSSMGDIQKRKTLDDWFTIVRSPTKDTDLQIVSSDTASPGDQPIVLITLDESLQEKSRVAEASQPGTIKEAYRLPDGSFVFFGSKFERLSYHAQITKAGSTLENKETITFATTDDAAWWIDAAAPASTPGLFACLRSVVDSGQDRNETINKNGVVLDFISTGHQ